LNVGSGLILREFSLCFFKRDFSTWQDGVD
jgi:hypothetical protein